jgi:hypothetical protein
MVLDDDRLHPALDQRGDDRPTGDAEAEHDHGAQLRLVSTRGRHQSRTPGRLTKSA